MSKLTTHAYDYAALTVGSRSALYCIINWTGYTLTLLCCDHARWQHHILVSTGDWWRQKVNEPSCAWAWQNWRAIKHNVRWSPVASFVLMDSQPCNKPMTWSCSGELELFALIDVLAWIPGLTWAGLCATSPVSFDPWRRPHRRLGMAVAGGARPREAWRVQQCASRAGQQGKGSKLTTRHVC